MTNEKLQYTIDAHSSDISKMLKALCKNGYLVASGIGRGTHYKINEAYASTHANAPVNATPNAPAKDKAIDDKTKANDLNNSGVTITLDIESNPNATPNAPVSSASSRDKKAILNELIDFCRIWRKGAEMARHVGKTQKYIVRHLIPEMIEYGLLIREYPDNPHHPAQRYRTKPKSGSTKDS